MKTPPKTQVDTMSAGKCFAYAAELLNPLHITDQPIITRMKRIGGPGKSFDIAKIPAPTFSLATRLYGPKAEALAGKWNPPPVTRVQGPSLLQVQ